MKKVGLFFILMIIGCILVTGCVLKPTVNETRPSQTTVPATTMIKPVFGDSSQNVPFGQLNVSIGTYNARLPVYVDDINAGIVSAGKMLNLRVVEGNHTVKVCSGSVCETVNVNINSAIKTTIDFEERLNKNLPQGSLNVSIGNYIGNLTLFIDNVSAGTVSPGKPLNLKIVEGNHLVKICNIDDCLTEDVVIKQSNQTNVDFGDRLLSNIIKGEVMVSIGGYNAELPVKIDNVTVGTAAQGKPLTIMVNTGEHVVVVCSGAVCEKEQVSVKFGKRSVIDFGERLQKNAEFPKPTARIVSTNQNGNTLMVVVEFINPDTKDVTISATISCQYSYINSNRERVGNSAQVQVTRVVKASDRPTQSASIYLSGSEVIVSPPVITDLTIT